MSFAGVTRESANVDFTQQLQNDFVWSRSQARDS
jgi:hypothetical protein